VATSTADWIDELKGISVLELSERIKALEEEFGVSATAVAAAAPAAAGGAAEADAGAEESTTVDVVITEVGGQKVPVIKVVRNATGLGLEVPLATFMLCVPIANVFASLPITLNGLGVREAAYLVLFGYAGLAKPDTIALGLLWFASTMIGGLTGIYAFITTRLPIAAVDVDPPPTDVGTAADSNLGK